MRTRSLLASLGFPLPTAAFAHNGVGAPAGLLYSFAHPIGGLDCILATMAGGVLALGLGWRGLWFAPLPFMTMMIVGFGLGMAHVDMPFVEFGIALSSAMMGAAAALGRATPVSAAMAFVGVLAVFPWPRPQSGEARDRRQPFLGWWVRRHHGALACSRRDLSVRRGWSYRLPWPLATRVAGSAIAIGGMVSIRAGFDQLTSKAALAVGRALRFGR